jgi:hypothetical protein
MAWHARTLLQELGKLRFDGDFHDVSVERRSGEEIIYRVMLLHESGLVGAIAKPASPVYFADNDLLPRRYGARQISGRVT